MMEAPILAPKSARISCRRFDNAIVPLFLVGRFWFSYDTPAFMIYEGWILGNEMARTQRRFSPSRSREWSLPPTLIYSSKSSRVQVLAATLWMPALEIPLWLMQPPWWLQLMFYALFTSLFTGILAPLVIERFREGGKRKEAERTRKVEEDKANVERLRTKISSINYNLVKAVDHDLEHVKEIKFFDQTPSRESDILSTAREFQDLSEIAGRYVEAFREAVDWREANRRLLNVTISELAASEFSQTLASNPEGWAGWSTLEAALQDALINPIIKGERISRDLLEHLAPQLCIQVDRTSAQGEGIPRFLKSLNEMIARDPYLRRFQGKQETIKLLGSELKKVAQVHVSNLQEKLDRQQG